MICKWIFKVQDNGPYKARMVVKGCEQKYSVDYLETFSPVTSSSTLRIIFRISAGLNDRIMTFDIKTAFLYGELQENIFFWIASRL